jgi:hypothetical protein
MGRASVLPLGVVSMALISIENVSMAEAYSHYSYTSYNINRILNPASASANYWIAAKASGGGAMGDYWLTIDTRCSCILTSFYLVSRASQAYRLPASFDIYGSNDESSWSLIESGVTVANSATQTLTITNSTAYRYYKFEWADTITSTETYCCIGNLHLHGTFDSDAPSKKNIPGDTYTAFDTYTTNTPDKAGDEVLTSKWMAVQATPSWFTVQLTTPAAANVIAFYPDTSSPHAGRLPNDFTVKGSNDGASWATIETGLIVENKASAWQSLLFDNTTLYEYYKLEWSDNLTSNTYTSFTELELYGVTLPSTATDCTVSVSSQSITSAINSANAGTTMTVSLSAQSLSLNQEAVTLDIITSCTVEIMPGQGWVPVVLPQDAGAEDAQDLTTFFLAAASATGDEVVSPRTGSYLWYNSAWIHGTETLFFPLADTEDYTSGTVEARFKIWIRNAENNITNYYRLGIRAYKTPTGYTTHRGDYETPVYGSWIQDEYILTCPADTNRLALSLDGKGVVCFDDIEVDLRSEDLSTAMEISVHSPTIAIITDESVSLDSLSIGLSILPISFDTAVDVYTQNLSTLIYESNAISGMLVSLGSIAIGLELRESEIDFSGSVAVAALGITLGVYEAAVIAGTIIRPDVLEITLSIPTASVVYSGSVSPASLSLTLSILEPTATPSVAVIVNQQMLALSILEEITRGDGNVYPGVQELYLGVEIPGVGGGGVVQVEALSLALAVLASSTRSDVAIDLAVLPLVLGQFATVEMYTGSVAVESLSLSLRIRSETVLNHFPDQPIITFFRQEGVEFFRVKTKVLFPEKRVTTFKDNLVGSGTAWRIK